MKNNIVCIRKINQYGTLGFSIPIGLAREMNLEENYYYKISKNEDIIMFEKLVI